MRKRLAIALVASAVLALTAPPAAAKGPFQVSVHDERTGTTTFLDGLGGNAHVNSSDQVRSIEELVSWPTKTPRRGRCSTGGQS